MFFVITVGGRGEVFVSVVSISVCDSVLLFADAFRQRIRRQCN